MPDCPAIQPHLTAYHHGELPPEQTAAVRAHLAACPACQAELAELTATAERLAAALAPTLAAVQPLSAAQREALFARAAELDAAAPRRPWLLLQPRWLLRAAATVAIVGLVGVIVRQTWLADQPAARETAPAAAKGLADARSTHDALAPAREATQLAVAETAPVTPAEDADTTLEELVADPAESRAAKLAAAELPAVAAPPPAPAAAPRPEGASRRLSPAPRPATSPAPVVAAPAATAPAPELGAAAGLAAEPAAGQALVADAAELAPTTPLPAAPMAKSAAPVDTPATELSVSLVLSPAEARRKDLAASRAVTQDVVVAAPAAAGPPVAPALTALYGRHPREPDAALIRVVAEAGPGGAPLPLRLELLVPPAAGREVVVIARWAAPGRAVLVARVRPAALAAQTTARVVPQPGEAEFAAREAACQAAADDDAGFRADLTQAELRARTQGR